ncbi:DMT family transporter [Lederbergia wuyishanensis]|uniref:Drug/metabolite transporter (DMT)-like permease n=1 Tax=Lederbergia wuyishanensis TaxID=1347903 RepID=A0ABU0D0V1_9BACI|nr:EamA family transporter [Lederbergia wuyishanensis]MCJ8006630.1 DMT family transporter [Lederbergia wuyishanensis]MDQ0342011.1 drug/metabolite transporter (DMT)-like permease [Lederbergia wuyishanensis]
MYQLMVMVAALLWGAIAIFIKKLTYYGFTEMEIVTIRVFFAFLWLLPIVIFMENKRKLIIQLKHIWYFIGTGLCSIVFFNWAYFKAINMMSISLAVMLLYTAPAFVAILSAIILKERLMKKKLIAVFTTIVGCTIIALAGKEVGGDWNTLGFVIGLCSGLGYALYTIFGKIALRDYDSFIITFYTFFVSSITLLPFFPFWKKAQSLPLEAWLFMTGLGLFPTVIAYLLYTYGLKGIESSTASILATVEPVSAVLIGITIFNENLFIGQMIGAVFILSSILIISERSRRQDPIVFPSKVDLD